MITGWLVKVALVVALAGGAMVELGSPIIARNLRRKRPSRDGESTSTPSTSTAGRRV
jgi:hypothetical protein